MLQWVHLNTAATCLPQSYNTMHVFHRPLRLYNYFLNIWMDAKKGHDQTYKKKILIFLFR